MNVQSFLLPDWPWGGYFQKGYVPGFDSKTKCSSPSLLSSITVLCYNSIGEWNKQHWSCCEQLGLFLIWSGYPGVLCHRERLCPPLHLPWANVFRTHLVFTRHLALYWCTRDKFDGTYVYIHTFIHTYTHTPMYYICRAYPTCGVIFQCCSMMQCVAVCCSPPHLWCQFQKLKGPARRIRWHLSLNTGPRTHSTENAAPPKSTKSRDSNSSVENQIKKKLQFGFVPRDTEESEFLSIWCILGM